MDNSVSATYTLKRLIEASKRGTKVLLILDDLNNALDKKLVQELRDNGGITYSLNPIKSYFIEFKLSKEMFRRHHEKCCIVDENVIIGSSNIADEYSGPVYGTDEMLDLNVFM